MPVANRSVDLLADEARTLILPAGAKAPDMPPFSDMPPFKIERPATLP